MIGYICIIGSHWWLESDCYGIFRWFLGFLYLFCGYLAVDIEVNIGIWYYWIPLCLLCCMELMIRFLWGLVFVPIGSIPRILIQSCYLDVSNSTTSAVCEDKLILFFVGYLVYLGYDSVRHRNGVPTPYGDLFQ